MATFPILDLQLPETSRQDAGGRIRGWQFFGHRERDDRRPKEQESAFDELESMGFQVSALRTWKPGKASQKVLDELPQIVNSLSDVNAKESTVAKRLATYQLFLKRSGSHWDPLIKLVKAALNEKGASQAIIDGSVTLHHSPESDAAQSVPKTTKKKKKKPKKKKTNTFQCSHCLVVFPSNQTRRNHVFACHPDKVFQCPKCQRKFVGVEALQSHSKAVHSLKRKKRKGNAPKGLIGRLVSFIRSMLD